MKFGFGLASQRRKYLNIVDNNENDSNYGGRRSMGIL